jgi:hypothetical protein
MQNLGLLALQRFGVAVPAEYFTVFYCRFSAFFWANKVMGFPPASLRLVSPMLPYNLLKARETSVTMIVSFTLASGICSCKRLLHNFLRKLTHANSSATNKPNNQYFKLTKRKSTGSSVGYPEFSLFA